MLGIMWYGNDAGVTARVEVVSLDMIAGSDILGNAVCVVGYYLSEGVQECHSRLQSSL